MRNLAPTCQLLIVLVGKQNNYNFQNTRRQDSKKANPKTKQKSSIFKLSVKVY